MAKVFDVDDASAPRSPVPLPADGGLAIGAYAAHGQARQQPAIHPPLPAAIHNAFFTLDEAWCFGYVSPEGELAFRRPARDLVGTRFWDECPDFVGGLVDRQLHRARADQVAVAFETFSLRLNTWVEVRAYPTAGGLSIYLNDVAQHRRMRQNWAFLIEASQALSVSSDYQVTLARLTRAAVGTIADWCSVKLIDPDGSTRRLSLAHHDPEKERLLVSCWDAPETVLSLASLATSWRGQATLCATIPDSMLDGAIHDPHLRQVLRQVGIAPAMVVPMTVAGTTLGVIVFAAPDAAQPYDGTDLAFAEELARHAALAIAHARLQQTVRETKTEVEQQTRRVRRLIDATHVFGDLNLDVTGALTTIARHVADDLEGLCVVRLLSDDEQWLDPVAICHRDARKRNAANAWLQSPVSREAEGLARQVVRTKQPLLLENLGASWQRFGLFSGLVVPLRVRASVIGTIAVWRDHDGHPYTGEDRAVLLDLTERAGLVVENTRLYQQLRAREQRRRGAANRLLGLNDAPPINPLTRREREILHLIAQGQTNRQIAGHLSISPSTVKGHVEHIIDKLGATGRTDAAMRAAGLGLLAASVDGRIPLRD